MFKKFVVSVFDGAGNIIDNISIIAKDWEEAKYFVSLQLDENEFVI